MKIKHIKFLFLAVVLILLCACEKEKKINETFGSYVSPSLVYPEELTEEEELMVEENTRIILEIIATLEDGHTSESMARSAALKLYAVGVKRITEFLIEEEEQNFILVRIVDETDTVYYLSMLKNGDLYSISKDSLDGELLYNSF